ncbi:transposase [Desulfosarcina sp. OttesenSCG-928-B08]|nr:transposase [Desulfosarcina sp. OttesenSCG-928-B08]
MAQKLGITLQFLPTYSPNLNLIERLWKFVNMKYSPCLLRASMLALIVSSKPIIKMNLPRSCNRTFKT